MSFTIDFEREEKKDEIEAKMNEIREKAKNGIREAWNWCLDNKNLIAAGIPLVIFGVRKIDKHLEISRGERLRNSCIYDRSMGMYLESKKPLTTAQKLDIDQLHKNGMSYSEIAKKLHIKWK